MMERQVPLDRRVRQEPLEWTVPPGQLDPQVRQVQLEPQELLEQREQGARDPLDPGVVSDPFR